METFWDYSRKGGVKLGHTPSNAAYSHAVYVRFTYAGLPEIYARVLQAVAKADRCVHGLQDSDSIPRVPGRMNQRRYP
jgi:hypothetical protein